MIYHFLTLKRDTTDFLSNKYLEINSCGFQNFSSGYTVTRKLGRQDYHILLIHSGECYADFNNCSYCLKEGNIVIYPPKERQLYSFKTSGVSLWLHFSGTAVEEILNSLNLSDGIYHISPSLTIFEDFSRLIRRFNQPERKKFANASLIELLGHISEAMHSNTGFEKNLVISNILTYINMNYNKPLSIDELAKKTRYSKSRFSHLFSEITGTTPIAYQRNIQLTNACELLQSTTLSVGDIAQECGFSDQLYFSRTFKKQYGISPTAFRSSKTGLSH